MERLKAFWVEHCSFRYNTLTETYEYKAHKLQHDFVEIDSRTTICLNSYPELEYIMNSVGNILNERRTNIIDII